MDGTLLALLALIEPEEVVCMTCGENLGYGMEGIEALLEHRDEVHPNETII